MSILAQRIDNLREWLTTDTPASRLQASLGQNFLVCASILRNPSAVAGGIILVMFVAIAIFAPAIATHSPVEQQLLMRFEPPGAEHWFGTDEFGRDIFSRIVYGSRITLMIVLVVSVTAAPIGMLVGCTAGYLGGWVETLLMRLTDIFLSFPRLVLALAFVAALGAGIENAVLAIVLTAWAPYARIARAEAVTVRNSDYVAFAELQGLPSYRIIFGHIAVIALPAVIVRVTLDMAVFVLTAAGLGFLGLGVQPPTPEWGAMISTGRLYMFDHWWVATIPGIAILLVCLAFNLLGDGLRDVLDPKQRR